LYKFFLISCIFITLLCLSEKVLAQSSDIIWSQESEIVQLYSEKYKVDSIIVVSLGQRMNYPDDVSVSIYLAKLANMNPMKFLDPRIESKKWGELMKKHNINPAMIFTKLPKGCNIPSCYKHAYQEYEKYKKDHYYEMTLYDGEVRNLVQLKFCTEYLGMEPGFVMSEREKGTKFENLILR